MEVVKKSFLQPSVHIEQNMNFTSNAFYMVNDIIQSDYRVKNVRSKLEL